MVVDVVAFVFVYLLYLHHVQGAMGLFLSSLFQVLFNNLTKFLKNGAIVFARLPTHAFSLWLQPLVIDLCDLGKNRLRQFVHYLLGGCKLGMLARKK